METFTLKIIANGVPRQWVLSVTYSEARKMYEKAGTIIGLSRRELLRADGTPIQRHTKGEAGGE